MSSYANGECCADDEHGGDGIEPWAVENDPSKITMGLVSEQHSCIQDHDGSDIDCDCETDTFSRHACHGCGSRLAGERYAFTVWLD